VGVTGPEFTADLNELRIVGAIDLPMLGYTYATVNNAVAETTAAETAAFQTSDGGTPSRTAVSWPDLRNQLQNILGHTAENMHTTGQTVAGVAGIRPERRPHFTELAFATIAGFVGGS
jgi:hypothetical protein